MNVVDCRAMEAGHTQEVRRGVAAPYYGAIDGLRACAVALVIAYHCLVPHFEGGFLGVDVFFVISGFVITLTLIREHDRTGAVDRRAFYWRRVFRLMPALLCMIAFGAATEIGSGKITAASYLQDAAKTITFTYNLFQAADHGRGLDLSHTWSLGVEEQFYLLWAPLFALILARVVGTRRTASVAVLAALFYATEVLTGVTLGVKVSFYLPWSRFDEMLMGAVVVLSIHDQPTGGVVRLVRNQVAALAACVALIVIVFARPDEHVHLLIYVGYAAVAVLTAVLIGHLYVRHREQPSVVTRVLGWAPLVWLGRRSYGIYLYHVPILLPFELLNGVHWLPSLAVTAAGSVLVAAISYRFLERPAIRAGNSWLERRQRGSAPSVPGRPRRV